MQLNYRGIAYQSEIACLQDEGEIVGKYRGASTQIGKTETVPNQVATLRYRGTFYLRGR